MTATQTKAPRRPPRWFVRSAWVVHRAIHRLTGGRRGLWKTKPGKWGTMRLTTVGRRSGKERSAILGYYEDGPNLQAHPDTIVELKGERRPVRGRAAEGDERDRLWAGWRSFSTDDYDRWASLRANETAVVVLEPRAE